MHMNNATNGLLTDHKARHDGDFIECSVSTSDTRQVTPSPAPKDTVSGRLLSGVVGVAEVLLRGSRTVSGSHSDKQQLIEEPESTKESEGESASNSNQAIKQEQIPKTSAGAAAPSGPIAEHCATSAANPAMNLSNSSRAITGSEGNLSKSAAEHAAVRATSRQSDCDKEAVSKSSSGHGSAWNMRNHSETVGPAKASNHEHPQGVGESDVSAQDEPDPSSPKPDRTRELERSYPPIAQKSQLLGGMVGSAVGSAVGVVEGIRNSVPSLPSASMFTWAGGKTSAEDLQRLGEQNIVLENEVSIWKGKHKALHRLCEQLEQELSALKNQIRSSVGSMAHVASPTQEPSQGASISSASLVRGPSYGGKTFSASSATVPLRPRVNSNDSLKDMFGEHGNKRNSTSADPPRAFSSPISASSSSAKGTADEDSGDVSPTVLPGARDEVAPKEGEAGPRRLFEYLVQFGVSASTAEAMWLDDTSEEHKKTVYCIPEQLSCFPSAPPVEELEQFCFPELVAVQMLSGEDAAAWAKVGADGPAVSGEARQAQSEGWCPPWRGRSGLGRGGGREEGDDRFIFVLSTEQDGGQPLYGVTLYFDEPSPVRKPAPRAAAAPPGHGSRRASTAEGSELVFIRSRRCYCLLSRIPLFDTHVQILTMLVKDRAEVVAAAMKGLIESGKDGTARQLSQGWPRSDFGATALSMMHDYYNAPVLGPDKCPLSGAYTVEVCGRPLKVKWNAADERDEAEISATKYGMRYLFGHLSIPTIITVITALLLERRFVVECSDPFILSAIGMSVPWLLRPYKWQTHFIPFLPPSFSDFLCAPVPFIAGVLSPPPAGYDEGVVVLKVESDTVVGTDKLPRLPLLDDLVAKLGPPHEHLSRCDDVKRDHREGKVKGRKTRSDQSDEDLVGDTHESEARSDAGLCTWEAQRFKRRCNAVEPATSQEVMEGIQLIISSAIRSIVSLREIRGHCIGGRDLVSDEVLTKETKTSFLKTVDPQERPFMTELLDTQLFAAYFMNEVSAWFSHKTLGISEATFSERTIQEQKAIIDQLSNKLVQSNEVAQRLSRVEEELRAKLAERDSQVAALQKELEELKQNRGPGAGRGLDGSQAIGKSGAQASAPSSGHQGDDAVDDGVSGQAEASCA